MDPVTIIGITGGATGIIAKLIPAILLIKETWDGIKQVDEMNVGFIEELQAFEFSLTIINNELSKENSVVEESEWWNSSRMTELLSNAVKTMSRLDVIFKDMSRNRRVLEAARKYYRGKMYETEIGHLTNRLRTYTSCLKLPTTIVAISSQMSGLTVATRVLPETLDAATDDSETLFEQALVNTNEAIRDVIEDIPDVCVRLDQRDGELQGDSVKDSQELIEIAASIVHTMTSVASSAPIVPKRTLSFAVRPTARDWENVSVSGIPISHESSKRIQAWSDDIQALAPSDATMDILGAMMKMSSFGDDHVDMDSQLIKQRFELAQKLYSERKFEEAVPHLEKTLTTFTAPTEARKDLQLLLAKARMEIKPLTREAELLLLDIVANTTDRRNAEALGLLATVHMELYPDQLEKAKQSCRAAIVARRSIFGPYHELTTGSIYLMAHLCELTKDSDALVWRQMLPDHLRSRTFLHVNELTSSLPLKRPSSVPGTNLTQQTAQMQLELKQTKDLLKQRDQELANTIKQMASLEESNILKSELLSVTKTNMQTLQKKLDILQEQHQNLQSEHARMIQTQVKATNDLSDANIRNYQLQGQLNTAEETHRQKLEELLRDHENTKQELDNLHRIHQESEDAHRLKPTEQVESPMSRRKGWTNMGAYFNMPIDQRLDDRDRLLRESTQLQDEVKSRRYELEKQSEFHKSELDSMQASFHVRETELEKAKRDLMNKEWSQAEEAAKHQAEVDMLRAQLENEKRSHQNRLQFELDRLRAKMKSQEQAGEDSRQAQEDPPVSDTSTSETHKTSR